MKYMAIIPIATLLLWFFALPNFSTEIVWLKPLLAAGIGWTCGAAIVLYVFKS